MTLMGLAIQNLLRKPFRTYALTLAVAIAGGAVFSTATVMWGVERSLDLGFSKFGADLLVVPKGALVGMKTALLTGEPSTFYMDLSLADRLRTLKGIRQVTPQLFLTTAEGSHCIIGNAFLVGFDPHNDFTVMPWLKQKLPRELKLTDAIVGANNPYQLGGSVYFYGQYFTVYGKLDRTGIGLYDNAIFIQIEKAYELAENAKKFTDVAPLGFAKGQVSALLVQLERTAPVNVVRFAISRYPEVKVISAGNIVTSVRQNLAALFTGTVFLSAVLIIANILMISAIFSTIINERKKELGLLRAIGAKKQHIFQLVMVEAGLLTAAGGVLGVMLGAVLMRIYRRTIGFHLESLNIPFLWPAWSDITLLALAAITLSIMVGIFGAMYPAVAASRVDPYEAIRAGE
jgi:putative ABC transport system permease protein